MVLRAAAAVATIGIVATQVGGAAEARLSAEINAHWRGAYDILVRPKGATLDLERTNGLVEPNFLALAGQGGISQGQVDAMRAIPGVEIAAPIAWVGLITSSLTGPTIQITKFPAQTTLYTVALTVSTDDGVSKHLVYKDQFRVLLGPGTGADGMPTALSDYGGAAAGPLPGGGWIAEVNTTHYLPQVQSPILAVDPVAEQALLGDQGFFLDPLVKLKTRDSLTVGNADPHRIVLPGYNEGLDISIMKRGNDIEQSRPVIPVLVSGTTYAPVDISIQVSQVGHPINHTFDSSMPADALVQAAAQAGPGLSPAGTSSIQAAAQMRAFRLNGIGVPWPGTSVPADAGVSVMLQGASVFTSGLTGRPTYTVVSAPDGVPTPAFRIAPQGTVPPGGPGSSIAAPGGLQGGPEQSQMGAEQSYRSLDTVSVPIADGFVSQGHGDMPYVFAPIAEYNLSTLDLPHDPLDYVPYGAYDPPDTTLIAGPNGEAVTPRPMNPTLNPAGLLQVPPMGIVDIHAAELLRGPAPIDAVRIRVGGISDYGPAALAKVEGIAGAIAKMGLDVDIVAASSPQTVDVYVPAYETGTTPPGDLGWVEQHWTTLGAAPLVESGLSDTDVALLLLALLAAAIVVVGTQILAAVVRTREAGILAAVGWRRAQVVRWQTSESVVAGLVVTGAGLAFWIPSGHEPAGLAVAIGGGVLFALAGFLAALLVSPGSNRAVGGDTIALSSRVAIPVTGLFSYGLRSFVARPFRSLTIVLGLAAAASAIAPAVAVIVGVGAAVGPTALASALSERLQVYQLALLGLVGLTTLAFALLALRADLEDRRREFLVLAASGWRPADIQGMLARSRLAMAVPAAVLALVLAALTAGPIAGSSAPVAAVAGLAGGLAFFTALLWGRIASIRLLGR